MTLIPDFRIALRLALRARFVSLSLWLVGTLAATAWMAAQFSGRQPATVALDVGLSVMRLGLPIIAVLLLQELLSQEFARRFFLTSITYPRPRSRFLLGRFVAAWVLVSTLLIVLAAVLAILVWIIGLGYQQGTPVALGYHYWITVSFIAIDVSVIMAVAVLLAVTAVTPSFVLIGTLGFMLMARSFSAIVELLARDNSLVSNAETYRSSLNLLAYLVPDLAALDVRMIALYGQMNFLPADWPMRVVTSVVYAVGLISIAVWALRNKRFS